MTKKDIELMKLAEKVSKDSVWMWIKERSDKG